MNRTATIGSRSTSSPWSRAGANGDPTLCCSVNGLPLAVIELKNPKFNDGAYQRRVKIKFPRSSASVRKGGTDIRLWCMIGVCHALM